MNIYAWLYNKRCNLFLKKKTRSMPAVSQLLSFSLKDESHIKHELLRTAQHKSYRKWASTSPLLLLFLRHSRWTFGFPWRKRQDLVRVAFEEPLVTLLKALPEKDISQVASCHSPQRSTESATRMLEQQ